MIKMIVSLFETKLYAILADLPVDGNLIEFQRMRSGRS
jgi:hypothetical protein